MKKFAAILAIIMMLITIGATVSFAEQPIEHKKCQLECHHLRGPIGQMPPPIYWDCFYQCLSRKR